MFLNKATLTKEEKENIETERNRKEIMYSYPLIIVF